MFTLSDFKIEQITDDTIGEIIDYGVKMVGAPLEWNECKGEGIKVGIIDTGIDLTHKDLKDNVKKYINFTSNDENNIFDDNGHGTHVAGIICARINNFGVIGVAPEANLYIAKAFGANGSSSGDSIHKSIRWMIDNDVKVINMSFSSPSFDEDYYNIIKEAYDKGITMVCAAGNEGTLYGDTIGYPAKFDETISVTAVDIDKKHAEYSSRGVKSDLAAAGTEILSCYPVNKFARLSGTSMATPIITGSAALLQNRALSRIGRYLAPKEMKLVMCIYSEDLGEKGRDNEYGCGLFSFARIENIKNNNVTSVVAKIFA